jgi:putative acetyltransferase
MTAITIAVERADTDEVRQLLLERNAYFDHLYAAEDRVPKSVNVESSDTAFFAFRNAGYLVGCGALIRRESYGELKRVYLREAFRGSGLGRRLLETIEDHARRNGCRLLRLETGILQPAAIAMYRRAGFQESDCFGEYKPHYLSIFMEKAL